MFREVLPGRPEAHGRLRGYSRRESGESPTDRSVKNARQEDILPIPKPAVVALGSWPQETFVLDCFGVRLRWLGTAPLHQPGAANSKGTQLLFYTKLGASKEGIAWYFAFTSLMLKTHVEQPTCSESLSEARSIKAVRTDAHERVSEAGHVQ